jgi:hypothetical protein
MIVIANGASREVAPRPRVTEMITGCRTVFRASAESGGIAPEALVES